MAQSVTLELPEEMLQRYQQSAAAARKSLETFMIDRLGEAIPSLAMEEASSQNEELAALEALDDKALWMIAKSHLSSRQQKRYDDLLERNRQGTLNAEETRLLHELGEAARRLTLKKAHAYMLLKWRGHAIPTPSGIAR